MTSLYHQGLAPFIQARFILPTLTPALWRLSSLAIGSDTRALLNALDIKFDDESHSYVVKYGMSPGIDVDEQSNTRVVISESLS